MKIKIKQTSLGILFSAMTLLAPSAYAEVTDPVGYVKLTFAAESDTPFSLPMNRPKVFSGKIDTVHVNEITIESEDLTANAFVYDGTAQKEKYYLLFTSGNLEGRSFNVTANGSDTITVEQVGIDDLASIVDATFDDNFEIRPHWTLNTLFPDGVGFPASSDRFSTNGTILFKPKDANGINHSSSEVYKYVTGVGWISDLNVFGPTTNDVVFDRTMFFTLRNTEVSAFDKNVVGDVPTENGRVRLFENLIDQDSHIAFNYPVELTLDETGLSTNPNFNKSSGQFSPDGDVLYIYDITATGYNLATAKGYYFVDGVGWYDNTNIFGGVVAGTTSINSLGRGFIIRKIGETEENKVFTPVAAPYLPFEE